MKVWQEYYLFIFVSSPLSLLFSFAEFRLSVLYAGLLEFEGVKMVLFECILKLSSGRRALGGRWCWLCYPSGQELPTGPTCCLFALVVVYERPNLEGSWDDLVSHRWLKSRCCSNLAYYISYIHIQTPRPPASILLLHL